jgi:hemolysin D
MTEIVSAAANTIAKPALAPRIASRLFEIAADDPSKSTRWVLWSVCALFMALVLWALVGKLDIVAVAEGRLVPETYVKIVQPAEGGIVREILVAEGETVQAGQVLVRLDSTAASADRRSVGSQLALRKLELKRIEAQLSGRSLPVSASDDPTLLAQVRLDAAARQRAQSDLIAQEQATRARLEAELLSAKETLSKLERTLPSIQQEAEAYERLAKDQLVGTIQAQEKRRAFVEKEQDFKAQQAYVQSVASSLRSQDNKLAQLTSSYRSELQSERVQVSAEVARLEEEATKQGFREGLLELKAPQEGIVKELATTTLGAVIQPGAVLLTLVPQDEQLMAEVFVQNQDIGFVKEGQSVRVKLAAYPFTKYGTLEGTVQHVSADATESDPARASMAASDEGSSQTNDSPFKALIALTTQNLNARGMDLPVAAGMRVSAEIRQGERTVMEYLLSPVQKVAQAAGGER